MKEDEIECLLHIYFMTKNMIILKHNLPLAENRNFMIERTLNSFLIEDGWHGPPGCK